MTILICPINLSIVGSSVVSMSNVVLLALQFQNYFEIKLTTTSRIPAGKLFEFQFSEYLSQYIQLMYNIFFVSVGKPEVFEVHSVLLSLIILIRVGGISRFPKQVEI